MGLGAKTVSWNEIGTDKSLDSEELLIRNTFMNAKNNPIDEVFTNINAFKFKDQPSKICWADEKTKNKQKLSQFIEIEPVQIMNNF
jgi:hypothetical protein